MIYLVGFQEGKLVVLREKCKYLEFFWSVFSRIWAEYGEILRISPYGVRMRGNTDQKTPNTDFFHAVLDTSKGNSHQLFRSTPRVVALGSSGKYLP